MRFYCALLVASCAAFAGETIPLFDIAQGSLESLKADGCKVERIQGGGKTALRITPLAADKKWGLRFPLPAGAPLLETVALNASLRIQSADGSARLRWLALETRGTSAPAPRALYQCLDKNVPAAEWTSCSWPLERWRWPEQTGDWSRVSTLALVGESAVTHIDIGALVLERGGSPVLGSERLLALAFEKNEIQKTGDTTVLVATDATDFFSVEDLQKMHANVVQARKWMERTFKDAFVASKDGHPLALLIFRKKEGQLGFLNRLGELWSANIVQGASDGYTIGAFATVVHLPERGKDRPVFLHEAVHALASRDLRLNITRTDIKWLQEGLANYVQLCLYPQSLDRSVYVKNFQQPLNDTAFFKPLKTLFSTPITGAHYAQAASLTAYLAIEKPELLRAIVAGCANGVSLDETLKAAGLNVEMLEKNWLEWGRSYFATDKPAEAGRIFPLPKDW